MVPYLSQNAHNLGLNFLSENPAYLLDMGGGGGVM